MTGPEEFPDCFGSYRKFGADCENCEFVDYCSEESFEDFEEDEKPSCFGRYGASRDCPDCFLKEDCFEVYAESQEQEVMLP